MINFFLFFVLIFSSHVSAQFSPLNPMPGITEQVTSTNASDYTLAGYCRSGNGDVTINFGTLNFVAPCNIITGIYFLRGLDVSTEIFTDPIRQCITQVPFAQACSPFVTNFLAQVQVTITNAPTITFENSRNYTIDGTCSEDTKDVDINIGGISPLSPPVCMGGAWSLTIDVSSLSPGNIAITADHSSVDGVFALSAEVNVEKEVFNLADNISGLQLWLDNDPANFFQDSSCTGLSANSSGDPIGCWLDKSDKSHNATETNASRKPSYQSGGRISFDGGDSLNAGAILSGATSEIYVFKIHKENIRNSHTDFNLNHPQTACGAATRRVSGHTPWGNGNIYWDAGTCSGNNRIFVGGQVVTGSLTLYNFESSLSRNRQSISKNGAIVRSDNSGHNLNITGTAQIGGNMGMGAGLIGEINEFVVINQALSDIEIETIEGYLACKWDLRASLPASHFYYNSDSTSEVGCP